MSAQEKLQEMVDKALVELGEHCDSVQIFVTVHKLGDEDSTSSLAKGTGNWYTRFGQVVDWIEHKRAERFNEAKEDGQE